jgi:hypothetical protein
MTAIVGITDGKAVVVAGDSAGVGGGVTQPRLDPKVFTNGLCDRLHQFVPHGPDPPLRLQGSGPA